MTNTYIPKIGDLVRRTRANGTVIEGTVRTVDERYASDGWLDMLWAVHSPDETILIHRPVELKTAIGTCYRHPEDRSQAVVRVDQDTEPWLGHNWNEDGVHWFTDDEVRDLVESKGWTEHPLFEKEEA